MAEIEEVTIKLTDGFRYLETTILQDNTTQKKIKRRLEYKRTCIKQLNSVFRDGRFTKYKKKESTKQLYIMAQKRGY